MAAQISRWLMAGALVGGMLHGQAFADPVSDDPAGVVPQEAQATDVVDTPTTVTAASELFGVAAVDSSALDANRGGTEMQVLNKNALDGVVSDNQAYNLTTGSNWVTSGSFADSSGLSTVIQNSGNNVLIQNATIINLQVQ